MLRRRPTRIEIDQCDIEELDIVRKDISSRRDAQAAEKSPDSEPLLERTARDMAIQGMSTKERLGVPNRDAQK